MDKIMCVYVVFQLKILSFLLFQIQALGYEFE